MSDGAVANPNPSNFNQSPQNQYFKKNLSRTVSTVRQLCAGSGQAEQAALEARHFKVAQWAMAGGTTALFAQSPLKAGAPTLLFYNHYSRPVRKKGGVFKRGDNLVGVGTLSGANFAARLLALDSWLATAGELPLNVKWLVEGVEGETNPHLEELLKEHAAELKADACLWPASAYTPDGRAMISLGTKGILTVELRSHTLSHDADSAFAGVLPNAAWRIAWALNAIKGDTEEIKVSGFGDESDSDLLIPGEDIKLLLGSVRDHKARLSERLKDFGLETYLMELRDPQVLLTEFFTPTANIVSFQAGSANSAATSSVPSSASARLDFRLVPNHEPGKVLELLKAHLAERDLQDIEIVPLGLALKPARTAPADPFAKLVIDCVTETAQLPPLIIPLSPGAEPMAFFKEALDDLPIVGLGLGHAEAKQGEKGENVRLSDFAAQARAIAHLLDQMAQHPAQVEEEELQAFSFDN